MQASISNIIEFGPDHNGKGFYGFIVIYSPKNYKNHVYEYDFETRTEISFQVNNDYQTIKEEISHGENNPKGEKK